MPVTEQMVKLHAQRKQALSIRLLKLLLGLWAGFDKWDEPDFVQARSAASIRHVESALREIQRETRQFQLRALKEVGVRAPKLSAPVELYPRSEVDLLQVYARPARDAGKAIAAGKSPSDVQSAFERRLRGIVAADVAAAERDELARIQDQLEAEGLTEYDHDDEPLYDHDNPAELVDREQIEQWIEENDPNEKTDIEKAVDELEQRRKLKAAGLTKTGNLKVVGWRRVLRPEASKHGPCGLCVVAATQWYTRKNLEAIHHECRCVTLPVTKAHDPGLRWNAQDLRDNLDAIYGASGGTTAGKALKRVRVRVNEHGELGSILEYRGKKDRWKPVTNPTKYRPPNLADEKKKLDRREKDLTGTLTNLRELLAAGVGDPGGVKQSIQQVEDALRETRARRAA